MTHVVVDTNVLHVANGNSPQASSDCMLNVIESLEEVRLQKRVCLDEPGFILQEYLNQRFHLSGEPGVGDAFFRWLHHNQANVAVCQQVAITPLDNSGTNFEEFPNDESLEAFDANDRKFVAVALASENNPAVLNAVDSDWWDFRQLLDTHGVKLEFLCPDSFEGRP